MSTKHYDIIIIGGGISGLYSAYNIKKMSPKTNFIILEQHKKKWIGGRINNETFYGVKIVTGAGIGRKKKDILLINLLKELNVPYEEYLVNKHYASTVQNPIDITETINLLKNKYDKYIVKPRVTFKEFATNILGIETYKNFVISSGYSDYENEDIYESLYNYGFDDNISGWKGLLIPWSILIDKLVKNIGINNIKTSTKVTNIDIIDKNNYNYICDKFIVNTDNGEKYITSKVIIATTISSVLKLIPGAQNKNSIYKQIKGQTFLRMYGKFAKESISIMKKYVPTQTIVNGPIYKIIPIDSEKGVYMIGYNDNKGAYYFKDYLENNEENRDFWCKMIEKSLGISKSESDFIKLIAIKDFYWPIGTHYYTPLKGPYKNRDDFIRIAQNPMHNMVIVGEMISLNQGWTEGALESVKEVVTKKWINEIC